MNPIAQQAIGSILRWALAIVAGYLVKHGIWTDSEAVKYIEAGVAAALALGWSLWQKYKSRVHLLTALNMPAGSTEDEVKAKVASGDPVPTVLTPSNTVPGVPAQVASDPKSVIVLVSKSTQVVDPPPHLAHLFQPTPDIPEDKKV